MKYTYSQVETKAKQVLEDHNTQGILANQMTDSTQLINGGLTLDSLAQNEVANDLETEYSITLNSNHTDMVQTIDNVQCLIWVALVLANS